MPRACAAIALLAVLALGGCSNLGAPYNTANPDPVCIAAAGLQARVADLRALDPATATADDYRLAVTNVNAAYQTFVDQTRVLTEAQLTELAAAMRTLEAAVTQIPEGTPPAEAFEMLRDEIATVGSEWQTVGVEIGCAALFASPGPS
jgi:outer membrane murein-binding lipoprotein Lpp